MKKTVLSLFFDFDICGTLYDPIHSSIGFGVKHFGVSTFRGSFSRAAGSIVDRGRRDSLHRRHRAGREPRHRGARSSRGTCTARTSSTRPSIPSSRSRARRSSRSTTDTLRVTGDLTIRGVTRPVELDAEIEGAGDGPDGNTRLGITATGAIDRSDWGITWNAPLANGAFAVGERVDAHPARRSRPEGLRRA